MPAVLILNLTQHAPTSEQRAAGVVDPAPTTQQAVRDRLTFHTLPDLTGVRQRAHEIAALAAGRGGCGAWHPDVRPRALIGGAPFLMAPLEEALRQRGIRPHYAFSRREVEEDTATGRKVSTFRHLGFVPSVPAEDADDEAGCAS